MYSHSAYVFCCVYIGVKHILLIVNVFECVVPEHLRYLVSDYIDQYVFSSQPWVGKGDVQRNRPQNPVSICKDAKALRICFVIVFPSAVDITDEYLKICGS